MDTREPAEYSGDELFYGVAATGHIPTAEPYPWKSIFASGGELRSAAELRRKWAGRVPSGGRLATYCTGGIRSA